MSDIMTCITLPGSKACGWMDYGRLLAADIIATYRQNAQRDKEAAEQVLAAADADFRIEIVRGVHVQHHVALIQDGRPRQQVQP